MAQCVIFGSSLLNTNNRSIEQQLVNRFIRDNAHLQMLSSFSNSPAESASVLSHSVLKHAFNFTSTRHLDVTQEFETPAAEFVPDTKHTISNFSSKMTYLTNAYRQKFSALFDSNDNIVIPQSYRKMLSLTFRGHKIKSGQYVLAHCNVPFAGTSSMKTYFHDPNVRPAKILFFLFMLFKLMLLLLIIYLPMFLGLCVIHSTTLLVNLMKFGAAH